MITSHEQPSLMKGRLDSKDRKHRLVPATPSVSVADPGVKARMDPHRQRHSGMMRRFIAIGLAAGGLYILAALIAITITRRSDVMKEPAWTRPPALAWQSYRSRSARDWVRASRRSVI